MDPTQRAFARSLRQLMARYPDVQSAREARGKALESKSPVPRKTSQELAQRGA